MISPQYHLKTKGICQSTLAQSFRLFSYILFLPLVLSNPLDFFFFFQKDYWPDTDIEFSGTPIMVLVSKVLDCHHLSGPLKTPDIPNGFWRFQRVLKGSLGSTWVKFEFAFSNPLINCCWMMFCSHVASLASTYLVFNP